MTKKDSTVSKAEQYRKERKARIAKSAKKSAKKNGSGNSGSEVIIARIIGIVFAVAVVVGISYLLLDNFGVFERMTTVYTVGDVKINEAELTYEIRNLYSNISSVSSQYEQQYGYNPYGFDTTVSPDQQKYVADDEKPEDEEAAEDFELNKYDTWMDFFTDSAITSIQQRKALCAEAKADNVKLDDEDIKKIDDSIDELESSILENAATSGSTTSLRGYLVNAFGKGMSLKLFRNIQEEVALAQKYIEYKQDEFYNSYSDDEIKKIYEEDKTAYDVLDLRAYSVSFTEEKDEKDTSSLTKAEAKKRADEMLSKITDEASFNKLADKYAKAANKDDTTYENADATLIPADASTLDSMDSTGKIKEWAFASGRKAGDKKVIELESSYYVLYMVTPAHETKSYDSRHILLQIETEEGKEVTDKDWDALLKEAEALRDEWKKGDATEDSFAALANEHSTDTGSNTNGGLYEKTPIDGPGAFVPEYEDWCLDPDRKEGDVGIVKVDSSSYKGYHIIYFKSINDTPLWDDTIRSEKSSEDYQNYSTETLEKAEYKITRNNNRIEACESKTVDYIRLVLEQQSSASSYSY